MTMAILKSQSEENHLSIINCPTNALAGLAPDRDPVLSQIADAHENKRLSHLPCSKRDCDA